MLEQVEVLVDREETTLDRDLNRDRRDGSRGSGSSGRDGHEVDARPIRGVVEEPDDSRQVRRRGDLPLEDGQPLAVLGGVLRRRLELLQLGPQGALLLLSRLHLLLLLPDLRRLGADEAHDHAQDESQADEPGDDRWLPVHFLLPWTVASVVRSTDALNVTLFALGSVPPVVADLAAFAAQELTHPLTCSSRLSHLATVGKSEPVPWNWMLPIRVGAAGAGAPPVLVGVPDGANAGVVALVSVAFRPVSHILFGMTMETSRSTPDHATCPLNAPAGRASLAATVSLSSWNCCSWPIFAWRSALTACWAFSFCSLLDSRADWRTNTKNSSATTAPTPATTAAMRRRERRRSRTSDGRRFTCVIHGPPEERDPRPLPGAARPRPSPRQTDRAPGRPGGTDALQPLGPATGPRASASIPGAWSRRP